eukprot:TRINITY_DN30858_c0_g1_i1.p1 TRINITY_DN30858_c0_g1~~TRINITY_DN30858_c0_g1_i1.p1  ORF type:complete len:745 (+),score=154.26 TRINITY_DN30858_c0_g1_i1:42-2237(+)
MAAGDGPKALPPLPASRRPHLRGPGSWQPWLEDDDSRQGGHGQTGSPRNTPPNAAPNAELQRMLQELASPLAQRRQSDPARRQRIDGGGSMRREGGFDVALMPTTPDESAESVLHSSRSMRRRSSRRLSVGADVYGDPAELDLAAALLPQVPAPRDGGRCDPFWEHVFVLSPKLCCFFARDVHSNRHPASAHRVWAPAVRSVLSPAPPASASAEAARWDAVARAHVSVADSYAVSARRRSILRSERFQTMCRRWWLHATGDVGQSSSGVWAQLLPVTHYCFVESRIAEQLCGGAAPLDAVGAWREDWHRDRREAAGVPFPRYCLSLLEIADTWCSSCAEEEYTAFLGDLLARVWTGHALAQFDVELQQLKRQTVVREEERARWLADWDVARKERKARRREHRAANNKVPFRILALTVGLPVGQRSPRLGAATTPPGPAAVRSPPTSPSAAVPILPPEIVVLTPQRSSCGAPSGWSRLDGQQPPPISQGPVREGELQLHAEGRYEARDAAGRWWPVTLQSVHEDGTCVAAVPGLAGVWQGVAVEAVRQRNVSPLLAPSEPPASSVGTAALGGSCSKPLLRARRISSAFPLRGAWRPPWGIRGGGSAGGPAMVPATGAVAAPAEAVDVVAAPQARVRRPHPPKAPSRFRPRRQRSVLGAKLPPELARGEVGAAVAAAMAPLWVVSRKGSARPSVRKRSSTADRERRASSPSDPMLSPTPSDVQLDVPSVAQWS